MSDTGSGRRNDHALVPYNPNQPQNHMRIMEEVQTKRSARHEEAKKLAKEGGVDIKARAAALQPHVDKLSAERTELAKWNTNGAGRNQGLAHVIDYAYGRPSKTQNAGLSDMMAHKSTTGRKIREELSLSSEDFGKLGKDLAAGSLTDRGKKLQERSDYLDSSMKSMMASSTDRKTTGMSSQYKQLKAEQEGLKPRIQDHTFYSLAVDDSKRGRIGLVEQSSGGGSFKTPSPTNPHGSEIVGVTKEIDRLTTLSSTKSTATPSKGGTFTSTGWTKTGTHTNGRSQWTMQAQTLPNTAASTSHNTDSNGSKLRVESWGPTSTTQRYSTVMGGHK